MLEANDFKALKIGIASPEKIRSWSYGEVLKPETINYRTLKPERDGLFCEKIFGPTRDYECSCGKYKRLRYKNIVCDRCGVEVTKSSVRRERMGHIELATPVSHIWYVKGVPSYIGLTLDMSPRDLEEVIYFVSYVVLDPGATTLIKKQTLSDKEYRAYYEKYGNTFRVGMGAEAIKELLSEVDVNKELEEIQKELDGATGQKRTRLVKRLDVINSFVQSDNKPEWMIIEALPVIPPELRPMIQLDGGRFATSDLNDLYRRVINRNNRLKKLIELGAPSIIIQNEKRMLQEAVDSLFDNGRRGRSVTGAGNRALKSLSSMLKSKQGRFRQNLLGKRVDYSGRSVIVVGPDLKMYQCGIPKEMALELFKPHVIHGLTERGLANNIKSAKKMIDNQDPKVWDIVEDVIKEHPVMLNRAPTLHRLGIQAFEPKLISGKAIRLHPLVCTAFNADFDGDQMAVHVPLGNAAVLEAQLLMLASHNILSPANGTPITVPSQDMVLGLYYMTKGKVSDKTEKVKGEGMTFYSSEEVQIAHNEGRIDLHANIKLRRLRTEDAEPKYEIIETTVGRVLFNLVVPSEYGYINVVLKKSILRDIIGDVLKVCGMAKTAQFLDDIKDLGYRMAFIGGLSFNLGDVLVPEEKVALIKEANDSVDEVTMNYQMGLITNNERYNQVIDIWTDANRRLTEVVMKHISEDRQGFNPVYMMLDSGARGSKEQIRQLTGMRGLMAKPQKSGATGAEIIENPIISNFKEGLSVLEYFISTHGARKGLADTALKTAEAGYLTRRLVDVTHDVIITEEDCGTLRGIPTTALKKNEDIVQSLYDRILGRVTVHDVIHPQTGEIIAKAGDELTEVICQKIEDSPIEEVEIRSVLTCESKRGVCAKCYGRNLATGKMVQKGEAVGVIAAQSIGEPGTQLTLRTFHVGGVAGGNIGTSSKLQAKYDGILQIDELRSVPFDENGTKYNVVIGRSAEMRIVDPNTQAVLSLGNIPYGAKLYFENNVGIHKGDVVAEWDPYNAVIISEVGGTIRYDAILEGVTYRIESDDQTGLQDKVIIESRQKSKNPSISIIDDAGEILKTYDIPVGAHLTVEDGQKIQQGTSLVKIPRSFGKAGDITGGLPRVTELFEARNPSDSAVVAEIDGVVSLNKKLKRGNREVVITSKTGEQRIYLIPTTKQILAQENDYVKAGTPLSEGAITPADILAIKGPMKVQEYIVNEVQEVYRLQGVKINDKHFEVIVRQMMRKVEIEDPGDTHFLEGEMVNKLDFQEENDNIFGMKVVEDKGDSENCHNGEIITARKLRDENSSLKRKDKALIVARDAMPATARQVLQGITKASLQTKSYLSAASFQETTKVLNEAAISAKTDYMLGMKENVLVGHLIPAGTGLTEYSNAMVANKDQMEEQNAQNIQPVRRGRKPAVAE